jgi:hypothetical protein
MKNFRAEMTRQLSSLSAPALGLASVTASIACAPTLTCDECPADAVCRDNSLATQVATLLSNRQPSIVNSIRAATLIQSHR